MVSCLTCIWKVFGSNLEQSTNHSVVYFTVLQMLEANNGILPYL